jgi:hypothetical protein
MKTDSDTNMDYEECRLRLYRLASISTEAVGRVGKVIERELVQLGASPANLSPEETECAARVGLSAADLAASKARNAEIERVLGKVSSEDMVLLKIMCGDDRPAMAERYVSLKGLG